MVRVYCAFHFDVWEIGSDNSVHDTPDMGDGVFVGYANAEFLSHEASCAFTAEKVLGFNGLNNIAVKALQSDLDWIVRILSIILEIMYCPRSVYFCTMLLNVFDEYSLYQALM